MEKAVVIANMVLSLISTVLVVGTIAAAVEGGRRVGRLVAHRTIPVIIVANVVAAVSAFMGMGLTEQVISVTLTTALVFIWFVNRQTLIIDRHSL